MTLYTPDFTILVNGVDVTASMRKFLVSIDIEDVFDTQLTVSKLELTFHAKYIRNWKYKDTIKV
jgi:phage protein D